MVPPAFRACAALALMPRWLGPEQADPRQVNLDKDLLAHQSLTLPTAALQARNHIIGGLAVDPNDRVRGPARWTRSETG